MKTATQQQRAYITRRNDPDNALWTQQEAERLAMIDGNADEALRRRNAAAALKAKHKREASAEPFSVPEWLVRDLGGARDTIVYMMKERELTVIHARTALLLREHREGVTIDIQGGEFGVYVEGGREAGLEAWCDKRKHGLNAWREALNASEPKARKAVERVICGHAGLKQARRLLGIADAKAHAMLKHNMVLSLDAATAYLGVRID